ncbi:MAG: amylo-alpha-1,6-glucosidase, partial [Polaromonas sp.]|nr:amylo-alpha-1,6-glucosidase [Polaromonas sp.]
DGKLALAPIALCEVQAYVYQAKCAVGEMAAALGEHALAASLSRQAQTLQAAFQEAFWCDGPGTYAIALDGDKRRCEVATSNAGHALWSGIAAPSHAARLVEGLMGKQFFSGWGIRTVARGEPRYNPMSYHNGSIWPHDNALIALGMARYGHCDEVLRLMSAMFDASLHFEHHRLPELFCGFARRTGAGPILYPVACSPQAWAAASVFALLQACLGLEFHAGRAEIKLQSPRLPEFIDWIRIRQLGLPGHSADLHLQRYQRNVGINVLRKDPGVQVAVTE